jgi:hypothetical protein
MQSSALSASRCARRLLMEPPHVMLASTRGRAPEQCRSGLTMLDTASRRTQNGRSRKKGCKVKSMHVDALFQRV